MSPDAQEATGRRAALVIGNGAYSSTKLQNPVNDATDIAAALKDDGFEVILTTDADLPCVRIDDGEPTAQESQDLAEKFPDFDRGSYGPAGGIFLAHPM